jgi:salicylate hydroxylase
VLSRADRDCAPRALQIYEQVRRDRTAGVQRISRLNGARYDSASGDLATRDRQLAAQPQERAWIWNYDAGAEAAAAAASL